jgi:hypothetical protein
MLMKFRGGISVVEIDCAKSPFGTVLLGARLPLMRRASVLNSFRKVGAMDTEKSGQQSNQQDPTQRDRDQKSGQQGGFGQNDPLKDRKPGQSQTDDTADKERRSA